MNANQLAVFAGVLLSLVFEYAPKFHDWYNALTNTSQRLIALVSLVGASLIVFGASCGNVQLDILPTIECTQSGAVGLLNIFLNSVIANQTTYLVLPKSNNPKPNK